MAYRSRTRFSGIFNTPGFPPGVKGLLIANVAIFLLGFFAGLVHADGPLALLALTPFAVVHHLYVWQLATYMFLHGGVFHILWNMLALWMFGAELESVWGTRRFLNFYFFCGIGAGVCVVLANYILPWGNPGIATIGSSGAIYGILMAYAILYPTRVIYFIIFPLQVRFFVMIVGAIAFLESFQTNSGVSAFAHLGGLLCGYLFLRSPSMQLDPIAPLRRSYRDWKLRRAKKKFQVYLRKQGSPRDPFVH